MNKYDEFAEACSKVGLSAKQAADGLRCVTLGLKEIKQAPKHNHKRKPAGHGNKKKKRCTNT
ncbi:MAG: hypothetical protein GY928_14685 [Colwellia sp.]|nr:hypothetical protein [Colwellia sp.]